MRPRRLVARKTFAENLRALRLDGGLSQEELADYAGLHRTYISQIEQGRRNIAIDNLELLAHALEKPLSELLVPGRFRATRK